MIIHFLKLIFHTKSFKVYFVFRPVHRCFFTSDNYHIASFSDDRTVNVWDIASETKVYSYNEHTVSVEVPKCKFEKIRYV